jgi:competence protein ComGC
MSIGWVIFIVVIVLGIIISNILLLKQSANMKLPDSVVKAIEEKKAMERLEEEQQNTNSKKPD